MQMKFWFEVVMNECKPAQLPAVPPGRPEQVEPNQNRAAASITTKRMALLTYAGDVLESVNSNSLKVFGRKYVPSFIPPRKYTGELLGVNYLLRQTGQPLQDMDPDSEETDQLLEDHATEEEQADEGFEDEGQDLTIGSVSEDFPSSALSSTTLPVVPTLPLTSSTLPSTTLPVVPTLPLTTSILPVTPTTLPVTPMPVATTLPPPITQPCVPGASSQVPEEKLAVDEHGMPGMDRVDRLAECLVELRHQTNMTLHNQQVSNIVGLWQDLLDYDKQRVVFAARHLDRLIKGRFRHKKKVEFTPGVESVERCVLGSTGSPAQWPDCCCLVEAIFVRLSDIHKSPRKQGKNCMSRWTLILQDYRKVRHLILGNGAIMPPPCSWWR
ncbi:uncharacterized protein LOC134013581 [Osmerus eperlanus]|uniref:uncharacterized protein LOC134013480 n=1 Tax=Osmerus eperlanus TaxID=29151 RepID=UPI002E0EBD7C